ncbi:hypothetical protein SERLA73DRAFT_179463 [Serpula lacrymans var. lacrymans S7.3]|uniref:ER membrane protein complex subunit 2 n=2 Tax=Serpula lacrymans var. lacrymans TaxID=341189 RepID=F8PSH3_SERL3|nr:uncharacterized protein SERLADRAFT_464605 [Serpula lacrymans var. lacrymans S7.9]EGO01303.1 hypothetical protein SERLA73DRAFT_179463 [Serpula lacrymans var. lacrymans S7.3]EGO26944.1 hypothetical protein SERLADRAFT_464605 [Serpula lacrymans var. lacrymans S7.9]
MEQLATYRSQNTRASQETFEKGYLILQKNGHKNMGDDGWDFLEQLTLAAIDVGRTDVADRCLQLLSDKFPESARVECLTGIRIEAVDSLETALKYYDDLLSTDSAREGIWKRKISVLRRMGKVDKAANELVEFLDTYYVDVEAWLELADIYATCNQYDQSLQALSQVLILAPQNPFYALQFAETAYTSGDIPLAIKVFLVVVNMTHGDESETLAESTPLGVTVRAWYGVKLCARRLRQDPRLSTSSSSQTTAPRNVELLDELATERLRVAYSSSGKKGQLAQGRDEVFAWVAHS